MPQLGQRQPGRLVERLTTPHGDQQLSPAAVGDVLVRNTADCGLLPTFQRSSKDFFFRFVFSLTDQIFTSKV